MSSAPEGRPRTRKSHVAVAVLAVIAMAAGSYIYLSPQYARTRMRIAWLATNLASRVYKPSNPHLRPFKAVVRDVESGDPPQKVQAITAFPDELEPADYARMFPYLIRAMEDDSEMVRIAAASAVGYLSARNLGEASIASAGLTDLLGDPSATVRATAANSLRSLARATRFDDPPPRLVGCLDDESANVRRAAAEALFEFGRGPELLAPVALRRIPTESFGDRNTFTDLFEYVRLEPSALPLLIEGLSSEHPEVRLCCTVAINHMGRAARPALPNVLALIRKELDRPHPADRTVPHTRIVAMAAGAIGELTPDAPPPPGAVDLLCEILRRAMDSRREVTAGGPDASASPRKAFDPNEEFLIAEAVWSLGVFGRSAATSAPLLLTVFESMPQDFENRGLLAESLAATSRRTSDEDRALASLAKAWKTAPSKQKPAIALALRSLGPKSERLVPELAQQPLGGARTVLRPVRYPRSRRGIPERE